MKPSMPNGKFLRPFNAHSVRRSALDHLHRLLNCCCLTWRQQHMQMIRHQYKSVQLVKSPIPAIQNLLDDDICQDRVDEERMLLPGIGRHKIDACLANPPAILPTSAPPGAKAPWNQALFVAAEAATHKAALPSTAAFSHSFGSIQIDQTLSTSARRHFHSTPLFPGNRHPVLWVTASAVT